MRRRIGQRASFFYLVVGLSLLLVWACPPEFRWVAWFCAALAGFWAILLTIENLTAPVPAGRRSSKEPPAHPFGPPPGPGSGS